jgi:hypothetical protein
MQRRDGKVSSAQTRKEQTRRDALRTRFGFWTLRNTDRFVNRCGSFRRDEQSCRDYNRCSPLNGFAFWTRKVQVVPEGVAEINQHLVIIFKHTFSSKKKKLPSGEENPRFSVEIKFKTKCHFILLATRSLETNE